MPTLALFCKSNTIDLLNSATFDFSKNSSSSEFTKLCSSFTFLVLFNEIEWLLLLKPLSLIVSVSESLF